MTDTARGFTISERRSIRFEKIALYVVFMVAVIAAVVSFVALTWLGGKMRLTWVAPLIPLMVDGFGVACTVGIARSQASGEPVTRRLNEWVGLSYALALSVAGNVCHVLAVAPVWLMVAVAAAPPILLAYGVHIYGRAMARGLSAHVMVDDPTQLQMTVQRIGDPASKTGPRAARGSQPRAARATPAGVHAQSPQQGPRAAGDKGKAAMRARFAELLADDPGTKPDAAAMHREVRATCDEATARRWVKGWWDSRDQQEPALHGLASV